MMTWTPAQQKAITHRGGDLVVSAGPGAGKTAVLTQRCLRRILKEKIPVDRLLVITFTENAAQELKLRIEEALRREFSGNRTDGGWGRDQLLLLRRSWISTIHSFCLRILRENGMAAGLSPFARVQDAGESDLGNREMAEEVVRELLDEGEHDAVWRLVDEYADGNIPRFVGIVLSFSMLIDAVPHPEAWISGKKRVLSEGRFPEEALAGLIRGKGRFLCEAAAENVSLLRSMGKEFAPYAEYLEEQAAAFRGIITAGGGFEALARTLKDFSFSKLPSVRIDKERSEEKKSAKKLVDEIRKDIKEKVINDLLAQTGRQYSEGETKAAPYAAALFRFVERFRERVGEDKALREVLGFSDLEHKAFRLLSSGGTGIDSPSVSEKVRNRFTEVLVDEFQDVNSLQDSLISCIKRNKPGNLFVVGDLKQSIYRFRLGDPEIFAEKIGRIRKGASDGCFVSMQDNFRTRNELLGLIDGIFSYLMTERLDGIGFDETSFCRPGRREPVADSSFGAPFMELHLLEADPRKQAVSTDAAGEQFQELEKEEREAYVVAQRLHALKREGLVLGEEERPLAWSDCAILLRAVKGRLGTYLRILSEEGIPASGPDGEDPFETIEMRDLLSLVRVLDNPRQDIPLAALMHSPFGGFTIGELSLFGSGVSSEKKPSACFHEAVLDDAAGRGMPVRLQEKREAFRDRLCLWRRWIRDRPVSEALWKVVTESGYFVYLASLPSGARRKGNVLCFMDRARQFSSFEKQGLFHFLRFLDDLHEHGGQLGAAVQSEGTDDAVSVVSIHKSKGLEWPVVVLPGLGRRFNMQELKQRILMDREYGLGLRVVDREAGIHYPTARYLLLKARKEREALAEELRILYVAFTRARERLVLAGSGDIKALKPWIENQPPGTQKPTGGGKIPLHALLRAQNPLGWICRAVGQLDKDRVVVGPEAGGGLCHVQYHTKLPEPEQPETEESGTEEETGCESERFKAMQHELASLKKILSMDYAFKTIAGRRAVFSVTELKQSFYDKEGPPEESLPLPLATLPASFQDEGEERVQKETDNISKRSDSSGKQDTFRIPVPAFLETRHEPEGRERGNLVHRFLQHMDLQADDLRREFSRLSGCGVFREEQEQYFDFDAISWFFQTGLGKRIKENYRSVEREASFLGRIGDESAQVLIRGVIDGILFEKDGACVFDYKTDRISVEKVEQTADMYRPQIIAYCWALERIWGKRVWSASLVFLTPRVVFPVPVDGFDAGGLEEQLEQLVLKE